MLLPLTTDIEIKREVFTLSEVWTRYTKTAAVFQILGYRRFRSTSTMIPLGKGGLYIYDLLVLLHCCGWARAIIVRANQQSFGVLHQVNTY